jgi:hypothetical protein
MQLLGNLLPSAQRLCEATLSFGLFTSRLRLAVPPALVTPFIPSDVYEITAKNLGSSDRS